MQVGDRYWVLWEDVERIARVEAFQAVQVGHHSVYGCLVEEVDTRGPSDGLRGTRRHPKSDVFGTEAEALRWAVRSLDGWLDRQERRTRKGEVRRAQYLHALEKVGR